MFYFLIMKDLKCLNYKLNSTNSYKYYILSHLPQIDSNEVPTHSHYILSGELWSQKITSGQEMLSDTFRN